MKTYDLEYIETGLFTSILPISEKGEAVYAQFVEQNADSNRIFTMHLQNVLNQFRKAGYSIRKAPKMSLEQITASDDDLLNELMA